MTLAFQRYQAPEKVPAAEMILTPVFRNLEATYLPLVPGKRPRKLRDGERHLDPRSSLGLAARMGCCPVFQAQSPYLRPWDERHMWIVSTWSVGLHFYSVLLMCKLPITDSFNLCLLSPGLKLTGGANCWPFFLFFFFFSSLFSNLLVVNSSLILERWAFLLHFIFLLLLIPLSPTLICNTEEGKNISFNYLTY